MRKRAVFLDRDGVLVRSFVRGGKAYAVRRLADFRLLPGAIKSVARLHAAGFVVIVVTNQPDIGNQLVASAVIDAMHKRLVERTAVDEVLTCPHRQDEGCTCRKPNPGMLITAAQQHAIDLGRSFMVGDRASDVVAGERAGCRTVFIDRHYAEGGPHNPSFRTTSLPAAVDIILSLPPQPVSDMPDVTKLKIKIFGDGADLASIKALYENPLIKGFTTNPTLMRQAGVTNYKGFASEVLQIVKDRPVSFEVFADDIPTMEAQAGEIASWGANVNVKIPITNTKGESTAALVGRLSRRGVICNVTAMFTLEHVRAIVEVVASETPVILSIFAGRIADTGVDPVPLMREAVDIARQRPKAEVLWASPRELLNVFQADETGCHIITVTPDVIKKLAGVGKSLDQFSLETVAMFFNDAKAAGYTIDTSSSGSR